MVVYKYGDPEANIVLIQPVGDHDVHDIENEVSEIKKRTSSGISDDSQLK